MRIHENEMKSLANGLACLRLLARHDGVLPVSLVCRELKLPRSSAYRLLATLASEGFLKAGTEVGTHVAGPQLLAVGSVALASFDVREIALPHMRQLRNLTTHSIYLMVRSGFEAVCIEMVAGNDGLRLDVALGSRRELHCSGIAKVFLPSLSEGEMAEWLARPLSRYTRGTVADGAALLPQIQAIERDGFAVSTGEYVPGARSVGVPIRNHQGQTVAALGLGGSEQMLSDGVLDKVVSKMKAAAAAISAELGFRGKRAAKGAARKGAGAAGSGAKSASAKRGAAKRAA